MRGAGRVGADGALELRRVGLPEGEDFDGVLEVAAQRAGADVGGEDLAGVDACHEELEAVAVFGDADAALDEGAEFEGLVAGEVVDGRGWRRWLAMACAEANRAAESRRARAQTVRDVPMRCEFGQSMAHECARDVCGRADRRKPPMNGGRFGVQLTAWINGCAATAASSKSKLE